MFSANASCTLHLRGLTQFWSRSFSVTPFSVTDVFSLRSCRHNVVQSQDSKTTGPYSDCRTCDWKCLWHSVAVSTWVWLQMLWLRKTPTKTVDRLPDLTHFLVCCTAGIFSVQQISSPPFTTQWQASCTMSNSRHRQYFYCTESNFTGASNIIS